MWLSTRFVRRVYSAREAWAEGLVGMVGVLKVSVHLADNLLIVMPLGMS